jgi:hypothetical protein
MTDDKPKSGLDQIADATKIGGPGPSLDEQFSGGRNPFNRSAVEEDRQQKIRNGGK